MVVTYFTERPVDWDSVVGKFGWLNTWLELTSHSVPKPFFRTIIIIIGIRQSSRDDGVATTWSFSHTYASGYINQCVNGSLGCRRCT